MVMVFLPKCESYRYFALANAGLEFRPQTFLGPLPSLLMRNGKGVARQLLGGN
jgi:hypothetical protein